MYTLYVGSSPTQNTKEIEKLIKFAMIDFNIDIRPKQIIYDSSKYPFEIRGQIPSIYDTQHQHYHVGYEQVTRFLQWLVRGNSNFNNKISARTRTRDNIGQSEDSEQPSSAFLLQQTGPLSDLASSKGTYTKSFVRDPSLPPLQYSGGGSLPFYLTQK